MTSPPESAASHREPDPLAGVVAFARAVTGTLRPPSLLDRFVQEIKASFGPVPVAVLTVDEQGDRESASGDPGHPQLEGLLTEALQSGQSATRRNPAGAGLATPLRGKRALLGAVAVALPRDPTLADLTTLEGMGAVAAVALEGARLIEALDQHHRRWEESIDAVSLALCLLDRAGRVERANQAFSQLLGLPPANIAGRPWQTAVPSAWRDAITEALAAPGRRTVELALGARVVAVTAFRAAASEPGRAVLLLEDQTERRRLQDRLVQSEKLSAIGQLIAGVAHDLNNPLTSVVGFADFLAESAEVPARIREPLRVIQQEAERASKIVKNLLSFARRQETRQSARLEPILEATIGIFRNQLSADRVSLELTLAPELPELDLNPNQIQQVFVNLIQNAAHAIMSTGRPGVIRVTARRWMDGVTVELTDDGPGMPPELAARAFEPFFTTKPEGQGTGLGLSISQGIVKEHGGRIILATREGAGASFTVELPGRVRPPAEPEAVSLPASTRSLSVLVLDDEPHILHYIRATLEAWGHAVVTVTDGHAGLERAIAEPYDLIISDLRMPRLGGREFFEALLRRAPAAAGRVAFSTGDTVRGDTLTFLEGSGRPCLQKPFSLAELRTLLRQAAG
jgi:signal transduction histidine kinase/CheY-like chemotaxis protein